MTRPRLFVGVSADEDVRAAVQSMQRVLRERGVDGRFEPPEKVHLTIAFLGNVEAERLGSIREALADAAARLAPATVSLDRLGAFPNLRRPRILWLGASRPPPALAAVFATVRARLAELGFAFGGEAIVHVTLCRDARAPRDFAEGVPVVCEMKVHELTLFQSVPVAGGTTYRALEHIPLSAT